MSRLPLGTNDPDRLGAYTLLARLGTGGMGTVYLGRAPEGRLVAIKVVRTDLIDDEEFLGRFRSEVTRARQVPPFCTAEVLDADLDHEPPYLVVEFVDGPSLSQVVRKQGPLTEGALHSAALGIATALTAIHGAGVIHRDLKPANVLFALGGLKVIDFGIARPLEATSQHTGTDQLVGTVAYMAPERFDEDPDVRVSPASDVFAWGAVVTFAGTGRTPFAGDSPPATAARILTRPPVLDGLPMPLRLIVARSLAKDPTERPTARELLDLLLAVDQPAAGPPPETPLPARPVEPHRPARRLRLLSVAALAVVALAVAGLAGYHLVPGGNAAVPPPAGSPGPSAPSAPSAPVTGEALAQPATTSARPSGGSPDTAVRPSPSRRPAPSSPAPPSAAVNSSGRNLALDGTATASSREGPGSGRQASYAIDGDPATRWSSGFSDPQWLRVDLGARWQISEIGLNWENAHATAYRVELSTDGRTWKSVYSTSNGQAGPVTVKVAKLPARFVRVYGTKRSTAYGYSLWELEVR